MNFEPLNLDSLFPEQLEELSRVLSLLARYANNKRLAMLSRAEDRIEVAMVFEQACERYYQALPKWARW